jgi:hypothetical protein
MKIKRRFLEKAAWFLSLTRPDEPRPLARESLALEGVSALEAFHALESHGRRMPTREPELLERYLAGKIWHGVTVENCAEDFALSRLLFSRDIKSNYPAWVADEIFSAAARLAQSRLGYVPTFVAARRDFSES